MAALKAASSIEGRLRLNPDSLVFSRVADLYRKAGKSNKAIDICQNGVARHPEYVTGHIVLGRCYLQRKRWQEAAGALSNVCRMDWRNLAAIKMLARAYQELGLDDKAGDLYALLLKMDPCDKLAEKKASHIQGAGITDILEIVGETPVRDDDSDRTVVSERIAAKPRTEEPEGTFEPAPPAAGAGSATEEMLSDATVISGSDVSDRMSSLFGEGPSMPKPPAPKKDEPPQENAFATFEGRPYIEATTVTASREDILGKDTLQMPALKESPPTVPEKPLEVELEETMIMDANEAMLFKGDSGIKIKDTGAPTAFAPPAPDKIEPPEKKKTPGTPADTVKPEEKIPVVEEPAGTVAESLDDIISGMMKKAPADEALDAAVFEPPKPASPPVAADTSAEDTLSGDDVVERLEGIFKDKKEKHEKESAAKEETRIKAAGKTEPPAPPAETADVAAEKTTAVPAPDDTISGDDVIVRLDGIFDGEEKKKKEEEAESSDVPAVPPPAKQEETDTFKTRLLDEKVKPDTADSKEKDGDGSTDEGPERTAVEFRAPSIPSPFASKTGLTESSEETLIIESPSEITASKKKEEKPQENIEDTLSLSETLTATGVEAAKNSENRQKKEDTLSLSETISSTKTGDADAGPPPGKEPKTDEGRESTAVFEDFSTGGSATAPAADIPVFEPKKAAPSAADIAANIDKKENPDDLPDQVLSPTLANIYLEQGQPQFALKICRRLAAKDPGNEELKRKTAELENIIAKKGSDAPRPSRPRRGRARKKAPAARGASPSSPDDSKVMLPLAGVRLRKKPGPKRRSRPAGAQE